ncbi:tetratricopeptide repeat protein [bacterium]|nr:tetratricopeptide repeat protein [bacterium]
MNKAAPAICFCLFSILYPAPAFSAELSEVKADDYFFYVDADVVNRIKVTYDSFALDLAQLSVKVLPVDDYTLYLTFPDGGNMLICLEGKINTGKLIPVVDDILTKKKKEADLMKIIGWKPRIDWMVFLTPLSAGPGILGEIAAKFKIGEVITPQGFEISAPRIISRQLEDGGAIDLMQIVSPVQALVYNVTTAAGAALILNVSYLNFNFTFAPDISGGEGNEAAARCGKNSGNRIVYGACAHSSEFVGKISPALFIPWVAQTGVITDGRILYISDKIPFYSAETKTLMVEDPQAKKPEEKDPATTLFLKGKSYFDAGRYKKALFYFNKVLELDHSHEKAKDYLRQAAESISPK